MKSKRYIISKEDGMPVSTLARVADNFLLRLVGLMGRKSISEQEAVIFYSAPSIHTFFMRFAFDLVFLDKNRKVVRICQAIKPWKLVFCSQAVTTIEFSPGTVIRSSLKVGDFLSIKPDTT